MHDIPELERQLRSATDRRIRAGEAELAARDRLMVAKAEMVAADLAAKGMPVNACVVRVGQTEGVLAAVRASEFSCYVEITLFKSDGTLGKRTRQFFLDNRLTFVRPYP